MNNAMKTLMAFLCIMTLFACSADVGQGIGSSSTKGIFFKDKLKILAFDDPDIQGVACYTTYLDRSLSFNDSSSVSLSCRKTGNITLPAQKERKNIFNKSKNWFFKKTQVDRFYDSQRNVLVYVTYTTALSGQNNSNSISVVVVD